MSRTARYSFMGTRGLRPRGVTVYFCTNRVGTLKKKRCGSSVPRRCWRGLAPGFATSTFSPRPTRRYAVRLGATRHKARALLTQRMAERLSAPMRDRLDAPAAGDDDPHSPLHQIKASSSNPSVGDMKRLLTRLASIEATGVLEIDVAWVKGNYQRILFHSVRTASADRVREMAAPRRHLALVCFLHQAWRDTLDQAVDMYGKLLDPQSQADREPPRRHAQGTTPRRRPDCSSLPPARLPRGRQPRSAAREAGGHTRLPASPTL